MTIVIGRNSAAWSTTVSTHEAAMLDHVDTDDGFTFDTPRKQAVLF